MAVNDYITLDGKRYKVVASGYQPTTDRQRTYTVGLTGKTIVQDFTVQNRVPQTWGFRLRVFINSPDDPAYGVYADLLAAYAQPYVTFIEHDDSISHEVGINSPIVQMPRVAANISGVCNGILFIDVLLIKRFA